MISVFFSCGGGNDFSEIGLPSKDSRKGEWGYVDLNGNIIFDFTIDNKPTLMTEGIGSYKKKDDDGNYYVVFVDKDENETRTSYIQSLLFNEGLALVTTSTSKLTYIDKDFNEVLVLDEAVEAGYFSEGLAKFKAKNGKWGFVDLLGKIVIPPKYDYVESFNEEYAMVKDYSNDKTYRGIIDTDGNEVIKLTDKYDMLSGVYEGYIRFEEGDERGYLNLKGEEIIKDDDWDYISPFQSNGYACVREGKEYGLIDKDGEFKIKIREDFPIITFNNLYPYYKDREYGFKNINQDVVISAEYDQVLPFFGNGAWVKDNKDWVFINKKGKIENDIELYDLEFNIGRNDRIEHIYAMSHGKNPIDIEETLESKYVDIDGFISSVVDFDNTFFGVTEGSNPNDVISYINSRNLLTSDSETKRNSFEYISEKLSPRSTRISTYDLFGNTEYDENISYYLRYYFNNKIYKNDNIDNTIKIDNQSFINRVNLKVSLEDNAYRKDEEIVNRINDELIKRSFISDSKNNWSLYENGCYITVKIIHSNSSINVDIDFSIDG